MLSYIFDSTISHVVRLLGAIEAVEAVEARLLPLTVEAEWEGRRQQS